MFCGQNMNWCIQCYNNAKDTSKATLYCSMCCGGMQAAALGAQAPVPLCLGPELVIEKALDDGKGGQADVKLGR